jgi:hypothetical protein
MIDYVILEMSVDFNVILLPICDFPMYSFDKTGGFVVDVLVEVYSCLLETLLPSSPLIPHHYWSILFSLI